MKTCSRCKGDKGLDQYSVSPIHKDGLQNYCKQCASEYFKEYRARRREQGPLVHVDSKICLKCKVEKPRSQFGKRTVSRDGLHTYCKPCWRGYLNKRRAAKGNELYSA